MVSLLAFIYFRSLLSSVSASLSNKLKSLPETKQFVSSANSFIRVPVNCELLKLRVTKDWGRPAVEVSGEKIEGTGHLPEFISRRKIPGERSSKSDENGGIR